MDLAKMGHCSVAIRRSPRFSHSHTCKSQVLFHPKYSSGYSSPSSCTPSPFLPGLKISFRVLSHLSPALLSSLLAGTKIPCRITCPKEVHQEVASCAPLNWLYGCRLPRLP